MEAVGLAVGVVGLGLQLATTLQTYVEGVAGAEDRLRELSFDVASTASTLKQLEDMLDADKAAAETRSSDQGLNSVTIFTDRGRRDIYSLSRRCEKVYQGILRVIVGASVPSSAKGKAIARNFGLSDLTATRLAQFGLGLKWPWVEPRVKACQEELRWLKIDLLLHLQVATFAKIYMRGSSNQAENSDDESALEAVAERLIAQRAVYRKAALEGRHQRKVSGYAMKYKATGESVPASIRPTASGSGLPGETTESSQPVTNFLGTHVDSEQEENRFGINQRGAEPRRLPFGRDATVQRIRKATDNGSTSVWDQFLALAPEQRDQVQDLVAQSGKFDSRSRSYLALETRGDEMIVFIAVSKHEVVYLTDPMGRTWQFPYDDFKNWSVAKEEICLLEVKDASLQQKIRDGQFDIRAKSGALIPPMLWHHFVEPGETLEMVMWREDPLSTTHHSTSIGKRVLERLFTPRRRPRRAMAHHLSNMRLSILSDIRRNMDAKDRQSTHRSNQSGEFRKEESQGMEFDDEDLFGFDDDEEDDLDSVESFGDLLARWTHVDDR
ncbi:hypothetical protein Neosp_013527 [[Neocosmospora] mangrovei]